MKIVCLIWIVTLVVSGSVVRQTGERQGNTNIYETTEAPDDFRDSHYWRVWFDPVLSVMNGVFLTNDNGTEIPRKNPGR
uniref:Uncharacterized protein n=1 Tax=Trichobilharzia regenti TaxID=157069 RepID=A0AA85J3I9_TRIRE|nr:unnamed protein product [Trichobilharzia regenti]CAH8865184.1 unnamed protein product [Trichobilharzia regenti]